MNLDDNKKYAIFKTLLTKTFEQVGYEFGFDKYYKSVAAMKNAVYRTFMEVKTDPDKFGADRQVYELVLKAVADRSSSKKTRELQESLRASQELAKEDVKALLVDTRNTTLSLINTKIQSIAGSKKRLDAVPLGVLTQAFSTLFDKSRIMEDMSTENVAILSKVEQDLPPDKLLDLVLKQREHAQTTK